MIKIWGRLTSINVAKAVWAAKELGLEFERIDVGGPFGGLDTPQYIELNPNSKIPTLQEEDGYVLWESNTIVRYLAARHGSGTLWPTDARQRADSDKWLDWQAVEFAPAIAPAFIGLIRTPEAKRNAQAIADSATRCNQLARILEGVLADKREYLAGDRFTIGDIAVGCVVDRWLALPLEHADVPLVKQWHERVSSRPSAQGVLKLPLA